MTLRGVIAFCGAVLMISAAAGGVNAGGQNPGVSPQESSAQAFTIAGTVVNAITGEALARARVTLANVRVPTQKVEMLTGEGGHFEFTGLPAGKYSLRGARSGYIATTYEEHEHFSTAIVTGPQFATEKLTLRLMPMATLAGHVLDEAGEPVRSAQIQLYVEDHREGMTRVLYASRATSDDRGYFDFSMLRPGIYFVSASAKPWYAVYPRGENAPQRVSPALDVAYPTTFYGGATEAEGAEQLVLKGGARQEIEIRLSPVPALRLTFQVSEQGQFQMPAVQRHVFNSYEGVPSTSIHQIGQGVFEMTGVPAGHYEVTTGSGEPERARVVSELNLTRDGQDLSDTRGSEVFGMLNVVVKFPGEEPFPTGFGVALRDAQHRVVEYRQGDPNGKVSFGALKPGKYAIIIGAPGKRYAVVRTISASGATAGHEVNIASGAVIDLTAELVAGQVRIEGSVEKQGKPMAGAMVALVPNDPEAHVELFRRDQSDFDGTFSLPSVIPGTYTIVAIEDAWGFDWLKADVLARYVQHGENVIIGEKMRGTVHLPEPVEVQSK